MLQSHLQTSALSYISTRSKKHCHDNDTISNTHRPTEGKRVRDLRPRPKSKITRQKIKCTVRQIIPSQSTLTEMHTFAHTRVCGCQELSRVILLCYSLRQCFKPACYGDPQFSIPGMGLQGPPHSAKVPLILNCGKNDAINTMT